MKRILVLARHFPPAVSGGARRPFLLCRALIEAGADVFIVAPDAPPGMAGLAVPHPSRDPQTGLDPAEAARPNLRDTARTWLRWPDPDIAWARRASAAAVQACPFHPDWIFTTSPPESLHAAGAALKRRFAGALWAADLRDSWLDDPLLAVRRNRLRRLIEARIAGRLLSRADLVTAVTGPIAQEAARYTKAPVRVLEHFLPAPRTGTPLAPPGHTHLVHTGSFTLSDSGRRIDPVLEAFARAGAERGDLMLHLAGRLTRAEEDAVAAHALSQRIHVHGVVDFERSLVLQASADGLLVTASPDALTPPGKLAEYRATGKPVIACGPGPWRAHAPGPQLDAAARLMAVYPGMSEPASEGGFDADAAASALLSWMDEISSAAP